MRRNETREAHQTGCGPIAVHFTHPVNYHLAFYRALNARIPATALFASDWGVGAHPDAAFGGAVDFNVSLDGVDSVFLKACPWPPSSFPGDRPSFGLRRTLLERRCRAVIVHGWNALSHWQCILTALSLRIPLFIRTEATSLFIHRAEWTEVWRRALLRRLFRRATAILSIGRRSSEFYRDLGVPDARVFLSPYSVDNAFYAAERARWRPHREQTLAEAGLSPRHPTIVVSGKLIERKRPFDAIEAHRRLAGRGIQANLLFLGDGPLRGAVEASMVRHGKGRAAVSGFKGIREIGRWYAAGDILLHPSEQETWGLAINEGMCFGMPVVTTEGVSAAADLILHDATGYTHPVGDVEGMSRSLERLVCDDAKRADMGAAAWRRIEQWSPEASAQGVVEALRFAGVNVIDEGRQ